MSLFGVCEADEHPGGFKRFRVFLFLAMIVISLTPLTIITGLSYSQYQELLWKEEHDQFRWNAEGAKKTIEAFIDELASVVKFVSREYTYEELLDQNKLDRLFDRLLEEYPGFMDIGVFDSQGIQRTYSGPYRLKGYDYSGQEWFDQVKERHLFISDVILGYRKLPHFVIAVSNKKEGSDEYWVLRTTINSDSLQNYISTISTKASQDIFLVNTSGVLQTRSNYFGDVLDRYPKFVPPHVGEIIINHDRKMGGEILHATTVSIEKTPWVLILIKDGYIHGKEWLSFRFRLGMIFLGSSLLGIIVIYQISSVLTRCLRDSSEKRQALLAEAEHTSKLASIGRLAAGVAHEINNPLAIVDQKAGLMMDLLELTGEFEYKDKFTASTKGIVAAVVRCKTITQRLLGFARKMDVKLEDLNLNDVLKDVLGFLEKEALYSHIRFELHFQKTLPSVYSDRGQLQQVFLNIINNAIDAIGRDGVITLTTRRLDEYTLQVLITDSGPGMPAEVLKHIFDPFFTTKEAGKGTGLGLSITYGLVKKLGGEITVSSEVGKGTTFAVNLPMQDPRGETNEK